MMTVIIIIIIIRNKALPIPNSVLNVSVCGVQTTGWTVRGSIPGKKQGFRHTSTPALWPTQPYVQ